MSSLRALRVKSYSRYRRKTVRLALDTTFAGANKTGVGIYSNRLASALHSLAEGAGFRLECIGPTCRRLEDVGSIADTVAEWPITTQFVLPLRLLGTRPHIVHSTSHLGPIWGPGKKIATIHDLIFLRYPQDYNQLWLAISRVLLPVVIRRTSAIITDSYTTRREVLTRYPLSHNKIRVVYPGIDDRFRIRAEAGAIERSRERHHLSSDPYILCLGAWARRKNLPLVLRAFRGLLRQQPTARLVLTGGKPRGMQAHRAASVVADLPVEVSARIHTTGHLPAADLHPLLSGAAILAYPSFYEGFGLPAIEAMAAGVPVVASDAPSLVEITGGAALIRGVYDVEGWQAAFHALLTEAGLREKLKAEGLKHSAGFTWEKCARETLNIYREVANLGAA